MSELKPCPFCGGDAMLLAFEPSAGSAPPYWMGNCITCDADGPARHDKDKAAEAWNRRETPETQR